MESEVKCNSNHDKGFVVHLGYSFVLFVWGFLHFLNKQDFLLCFNLSPIVPKSLTPCFGLSLFSLSWQTIFGLATC